MSNDDRRLIEDYLPIEAISKEASREKSVRKGHISTLHLWWARRPLVACRAAVYGALVPASRFRPQNGPEEKRESLTRANAAKFVERLCKYPGDPQVIAEAQRHILEAHAERLTQETGKRVTVKDILEGRAPRPKVLDMFAGGGAIPLEALRLGCEAYALDLNPVAYIIELCTLVYPQKYGKPDKNAKGSAKDGTWAGLAEEVHYWGNWVLEKVKAEIGDLYPPVPDPKAPKATELLGQSQLEMAGEGFERKGQQKLGVEVAAGYLTPVAYLWTRTVRCRNPSCGATVPLVRQTWLCKKKNHYVALRMIAPKGKKQARFEVVEATSEEGLGFDPAAFSKGGNATCPFCGTVAGSDYVKGEGGSRRVGQQPMALICTRAGEQGKVYLPSEECRGSVPEEAIVQERLAGLCRRSGITVPEEPLEANPRSFDVQRYGFLFWKDVFTSRQITVRVAITAVLRDALLRMKASYPDEGHVLSLFTCTALSFSRLTTQHNAFTFVHPGRGTLEGPWGDAKFPMSMDFAEPNIFSNSSGSYKKALEYVVAVYDLIKCQGLRATVLRGDARSVPLPDQSFDAVITDPPYYDSVSYSNLSDAFYIWCKRALGTLYAEHFSGQLTPKKSEGIAAAYRHLGDWDEARSAYEEFMAASLQEARRVLKPNSPLTLVYAHKTTAGWATLVTGIQRAGFVILEAWPLRTEMQGGRKKVDRAMLASSIFLVARKLEGASTGSYESEVQPELERIIRERVETLWEMGVSGADLVIACVGAGLRAFTRYLRVEYQNGEEVAAERFLSEVETGVLGTILARLSKEVGGKQGLASVDPATRFYILWRYTYRSAALDAGEAIIFANGTHVELDGLRGLSSGSRPLLEKEKGTYRLLDYTERGDDKRMGMPSDDGQPASLIDALQRTLWLMEKRPGHLDDFLREAQPNLEQMRLVAQALAGSALKGKSGEDKALMSTTQSEQSALGKLLANWRALVEQPTGPLFQS